MEMPSIFSSSTNDSREEALFIVLSIQETTSCALYALSSERTGIVWETSGKSPVRSLPTRLVGLVSLLSSGWARSIRTSSSNRASYSRSLMMGLPST